MSSPIDSPDWWELHLRKARGGVLAESEQRLYESALARQDREASPLLCDLEMLKQLRTQASILSRTNDDLRHRLGQLDDDIRIVEKSMSKETREALGVKG